MNFLLACTKFSFNFSLFIFNLSEKQRKKQTKPQKHLNVTQENIHTVKVKCVVKLRYS